MNWDYRLQPEEAPDEAPDPMPEDEPERSERVAADLANVCDEYEPIGHMPSVPDDVYVYLGRT